ncbi:uncharacterized protein LOC134744918 [Cydia strobilella]|uniref:uncharacterized protein LOC134744918 n=1 Tax=Cydia strobilella TaxID=1100964 RepID=UPI003006F934
MPHTIIKLLLLVASVAVCVTQDTEDVRESRLVQTAQGPVRGYKKDDIFYFYGIPYATAPTGTRRFTAPLPGPVWMSPLEAVNDKIICPQGKFPMLDLSNYKMREDCLVVNIYMPDTEETNLPVVVYVHGGGYQVGAGAFASPSPLVRTKKVIAVTFNYRLGAHGFLCLGTDNAPGNAGMKDQVALLRWVQKNIAKFGGNPNEVTIAGYSAGSSAVDLLMLSETTKGLYNKVIPESGASVAVWSVQLDPVQNAKDFAKQLNFSNADNINSLEEFYTTSSYEALTSDIFFDKEDSNFLFSPCVERDTGVEMFLDDAPVNILTQGKYKKVPVLYGFANMEGLFRVPWFKQWKESMNERFSDFLPADLQFKSKEEKERIAKDIKEFYFGDKRISAETIQGFIDYFSDVIFAFPYLRSVKLQVEAGSDSIYLYEYSFFRPHPENVDIPEYVKNIKGAGHCAQTEAVTDFGAYDNNFGPDSDEYKKMRNIMIELWVNFITTGKPVPEESNLPSWPPVGANRSPYMSLGEEIKLKGPCLEERTLFWEDIYGRFYKSPVAPSTRKPRSELSQSVSRQLPAMPHTIIKLLLLVASVAVCVTQDTEDVRESRLVQTAQGPVRGYKKDDIFYFYGIPYATAPTGTRRFTAPLPGPVWMSPLEAVNDKIICPQGQFPMLDLSNYEMREDCLVVNIYMPDTEKNNLPVVVYVHGGAYQVGAGVFGSPSSLVRTKKVIAVTFNYRLGAHGFLCLGTENAPGNAGMKDQVALLRWIRKNIASFGGNPNNVTIAGYSAGSSSVDLLMLSDITKGLYNKVIPESGASVAAWSVQIDPVQNAKDFAKQLNFTNVDNINSLEEFYSTVSYEALMSDIFFDRKDSVFLFSPCVERDTGVEIFLHDTPVNILTQGKYRKVPVLYGFSNMEGLLRVPLFEQWQELMNDRFSDFLPADLQFKNKEEKERIAKDIKEFYFGGKRISAETIQGFIDYFSDVIFAFPHLRSVKMQVEAGSDSIYLYEYSFFRPYPENAGIPEYVKNIKGADHCAQTVAVLETGAFIDVNVGPDSDEYKKMKNIMVELWVNFITTGKPVPEGSNLPSWPPVGANRSPYMSLGEKIKLKGPLLEERTLFWENIYGRFYRSPVAPSPRKDRSEL